MADKKTKKIADTEAKYIKLLKGLKKVKTQKKLLLDEMQLINQKQNKLLQLVEKLEREYDNAITKDLNTGSEPKIMDATKQMQETQMSFNLQYLQLQSQMQNENRAYTAVSNIMETKHDTVKNSTGNVR